MHAWGDSLQRQVQSSEDKEKNKKNMDTWSCSLEFAIVASMQTRSRYCRTKSDLYYLQMELMYIEMEIVNIYEKNFESSLQRYVYRFRLTCHCAARHGAKRDT